MSRRLPSISEELDRRMVAYVNRRAGAAIRRGGRAGSGAGKKKAQALYALTGFSAANFYQTQAGGGESGDASGFGAVIGLRVNALGVGASRHLLNRNNGSNGGWLPYISSTNTIAAWFASGAAAAITTPAYQLQPSDVGKFLMIVTWHDGAKVRLAVNRQQVLDGTAITGFSSIAAGMTMSGLATAPSSGPLTAVDLLFTGTFRGTPTFTQLQSLFDDARVLGDMPTTMQGATVTHRNSIKNTLAGQTVVDGQTAPASLPDTVTAATVDALARQGSPTVKVIDTSVDGRKTYGALGFSATSRLQTAAGLGIRGAAPGFTVRLVATFYSLSGTECVAACSGASALTGWAFLRISAALNVYAGTGATALTAAKTLVAGDLGTPALVHLVFNGSTVEIFYNGSSAGVSSSGSYVAANATYPTVIGDTGALGFPGPSQSVYVLGGGNYVMTSAECSADYSAWKATGRLTDVPSKPDLHIYDLTQAIVANGGPDNGFPATVQDRIGTDHLTRVGGLQVGSGNGLRNFDAAHWAQTPGSAAPGSVSGFYAEVLFDYAAAAGIAETLFACSADQSYAAGFAFLQYFGTFGVYGGGQSIFGAAFTPGLWHMALRYDGTVLRAYRNGVIVSTSASYTHTPATSPVTFGIIRPSLPVNTATAANVRGGAYGNTIPTDGEIATAASAALSAGKIVGVPGKFTKLWSLVDDVIDAGGKVPALIRERVAGVDNMAVVGSPLQVAQRVERIWGWEAAA